MPFLPAPRHDVIHTRRGAENKSHTPILKCAQVHVGNIFLQDPVGSLQSVPEHLSETGCVRSHLRRSVPLRQTRTDFRQSLHDEASRKVDVNIILKVDRNIRQPEEADRANFLHVRQPGHAGFNRECYELLDVFGSQSRRFRIDVDLDRCDVRKGINRDGPDGIQTEKGDDEEGDENQKFVAKGEFNEFVQHDAPLVTMTFAHFGAKQT